LTRIPVAIAASLLVAGAAAVAQTAVSVRPVAVAGRTVHFTTTQDLSISAYGVAGLGQIAMQSAGTLAFTQVNRTVGDQGQLEAEITIEKLEMTRSLNGATEDKSKAAAAPDPVGQKLLAVFDRTGKLADVKVPKELEVHSASLRQLLTGAYSVVNTLPDMPMTIGETRAVDGSALPLRLPGAANAAASLPKLSITLRAIERVNGDQIARLIHRVESSPSDPLVVNGSGTVDVNLDKGFVAASSMDWNIAGAVPGAAAGTAAQPPRVQATFKMTVNAAE
jgi:hypothetical protein